MKTAFLVIVDHDASAKPWIADIHWSLLREKLKERMGWDIHTTEATAEMLKHHGIPYV